MVPVPATCTGSGRTAANIRYLLDYFSDRTGLVTLSAASLSTPIKFQHRGRAHLVMMPMFVNWDSEGAQAPKPEGEPEAPPVEEPKPRRKHKGK